MKNSNKINILNNPYQYTRTISFRADLDKKYTSSCFVKTTEWNDDNPNISDLSNLLLKFHDILNQLLYLSSRQNGQTFRKNISINKTWLKIWHKQLFYMQIKDNTNRQGKYFFKDLMKNLDLKNTLEKQLENWKKHSEEIKKVENFPKEKKPRKSDTAEHVRALLRLWKYFNALLKEIHCSELLDDEKIKKLKDNLKKIQKQLKYAERIYLSTQSSGVEIARASLNYYTVDKEPKEYYENKLQKTKNDIDIKSFSKIQKNEKDYKWILVNEREIKNSQNKKRKQEFFQFKSKQEQEWLKRYYKKYKDQLTGDLDTELSLPLDQTYSMMKAFKAEQKSIFYELASRIEDNHNQINQNNANFLRPGFQMKPTTKKSYNAYTHPNKNHILYNYSFSSDDFNSIDKLSDMFSLFKGNLNNKRNDYQKFIKLCKNIKRQKEPVQNLKNQRGNYLKFFYFKDYINFCEEYKKTAQEKGRLNAQVKGLEREKREALQTDYWALIFCNQNQHQLWLIPKEKRKKAREFIYNERSLSDGTQYLYCFESLTMRALHKLCFAEQSSFSGKLPENLKTLQKDVKESNTKGDTQKLDEKNQKKLKFFKELLKSGYANKKLNLKNFNFQECYKSNNLEDFEKALEMACYYVKKISLDENEKSDFINKFNVTVLDISSYDLEGRNKKHKLESDNKYHTDLWKSFLSGIDKPESDKTVKGFKIGKVRLNPEIKIRYRKMKEDVKNFFNKKAFPPSFKNRFLKNQLTAHFTLSLNAGKKYEDLAFSKPEDILKKIKDFNQKLNQEMNFKRAWKYGIDRGNIELATLCLAKFNSDKEVYEVNGKKVVQPKFPNSEKDIQCYILKDYNLRKSYITQTEGEKIRQAIKNLSYFIEDRYLNDERYFEKKNISCLDLTTAKVIKGKIITNGDVLTYLKLKKSVAKRQIFELYGQGKIKQATKLEWSEFEHGDNNRKRENGVLNISLVENPQRTEETIYWYRKEYESILIDAKNNIKYEQINIKNSLNYYLDQLRQDSKSHTPSILKINHLRNAITANMVGVICFLQKKYPGFIIMEDLKKEIINKHFFQHNENISRRLENALYNKFQALGLVPPHVKDIIQLRENSTKKEKQNNQQKLSQIGAIVFVPEKNTSKDCPYCKETSKKEEAIHNDLKFRQHRFICEGQNSCDFDTYYFKNKNERIDSPSPAVNENNFKEEFRRFKDINDPDRVAAYNISKKIQTAEEIERLEL